LLNTSGRSVAWERTALGLLGQLAVAVVQLILSRVFAEGAARPRGTARGAGNPHRGVGLRRWVQVDARSAPEMPLPGAGTLSTSEWGRVVPGVFRAVCLLVTVTEVIGERASKRVGPQMAELQRRKSNGAGWTRTSVAFLVNGDLHVTSSIWTTTKGRFGFVAGCPVAAAVSSAAYLTVTRQATLTRVPCQGISRLIMLGGHLSVPLL